MADVRFLATTRSSLDGSVSGFVRVNNDFTAVREGTSTLGMGGLSCLHVVHRFGNIAQFDLWEGKC